MDAKKARELAAFYTPEGIAHLLARWAIRKPIDTILDPSFGGCAFLDAAVSILQSMGNSKAGAQIYGIDIDRSALHSIEGILRAGGRPSHFVRQDFFKVTPEWIGRFDVILGNPPYIRHHSIAAAAQKRARECLTDREINLSARASYWAYFVVYAIQFLRPGGRLGLVLPGAFLHTDYSRQVREYLETKFSKIWVVLLNERIFSGTQEETVILCAEGAHQPHQSFRVGASQTVDALYSTLASLETATVPFAVDQSDGGFLRALIPAESLNLYDQIAGSSWVVRLGDWVKIRIGVVTGSNDFFILSPDQQKKLGIPAKYLMPLVRRLPANTGLWLANHPQALDKRSLKSLLLSVQDSPEVLPERLAQYLQEGQKKGIAQNYKCKTRNPWYAIPHVSTPPALVSCMSAAWPRLVINKPRYLWTNNLLGAYWKDAESRRDTDWRRLAVGTVSTISQLSAELVGRSYGGGVLKTEPSELANLVVPILPEEVVRELAGDVDRLLRDGHATRATQAVDDALIAEGIGLTSRDIAVLQNTRDVLYRRRRRVRPA